jgi:hypothetical protein
VPQTVLAMGFCSRLLGKRCGSGPGNEEPDDSIDTGGDQRHHEAQAQRRNARRENCCKPFSVPSAFFNVQQSDAAVRQPCSLAANPRSLTDLR